jgi:hypothetical protein
MLANLCLADNSNLIVSDIILSIQIMGNIDFCILARATVNAKCCSKSDSIDPVNAQCEWRHQQNPFHCHILLDTLTRISLHWHYKIHQKIQVPNDVNGVSQCHLLN